MRLSHKQWGFIDKASLSQHFARIPSQTLSTADTMAATQPFEYTVRIMGNGGTLQGAPLSFMEEASIALFSPNPPPNPTRDLLATLATRHHDEIMGMQDWRCWNCSRHAVSMLHNPMSYLYKPDPEVVDLALPICRNRGACDAEGRQMFAQEIARMQVGGGL